MKPQFLGNQYVVLLVLLTIQTQVLTAAEPRTLSTWQLPARMVRLNPVANNGQEAPASEVVLINGAINGQAIDAQGRPITNVEVVVYEQGRLHSRTITGANGQFSFRDLSPGFHTITCGSNYQHCRLWPAAYATAHTQRSAVIVATVGNQATVPNTRGIAPEQTASQAASTLQKRSRKDIANASWTSGNCAACARIATRNDVRSGQSITAAPLVRGPVSVQHTTTLHHSRWLWLDHGRSTNY